MCTNLKRVYNKYVNKYLLVNCGKCEACQQEKASRRANRIRSSLSPGEICLFVTLTYHNDFVPYISTRGLLLGENYDVPIMRRSGGRYIRVSKKNQPYLTAFCHDYGTRQIDVIPRFTLKRQDFSKKNSNSLRHLNGMTDDKIGVCYYPDVQNFMKRLRINLKRQFDFNEKFKTYCCSEYGSKTHRPHFHLLLFIPREQEAAFRRAIVKSWPYADYARTTDYIEVARDCASYVSSYVNGNHLLPDVLSTSVTCQKHSYSQGFGCSIQDFMLSNVLQSYERGAMSFNREIVIEGIHSFVRVPIPSYVISRYFPRFHGDLRLSSAQIGDCIVRPEIAFDHHGYRTCPITDEHLFRHPSIGRDGHDFEHWSHGVIPKFYTRIINAYKRFHAITGMNIFDYAIYYVRVWNFYRSEILRHSYDGISSVSDLAAFYDNISDYVVPLDYPVTGDGVDYEIRGKCFWQLYRDCAVPIDKYVLNPHLTKSRSFLNRVYSDRFRRMSKQKNITNTLMAAMGHNV